MKCLVAIANQNINLIHIVESEYGLVYLTSLLGHSTLQQALEAIHK
jgi:hypothetical protein